jgi:hypothetical protein
MNNYSIALYLHIVGALGFFVALGLEWTGLSQLRSVMTIEQVRGWMGILKNVRKVGFVSMLTTVITGIYLMVRVWGGEAWIIVTVGSTRPGDRAGAGGHHPANGGHWAGSGHGERTNITKIPQPSEQHTPLDLYPDPSGHRAGHRLSQDRQA